MTKKIYSVQKMIVILIQPNRYTDNILAFDANHINSENYKEDIKINKNEIENSLEYNLSSTDSNIEKEVDEISIVDTDIRKNIIFLKL